MKDRKVDQHDLEKMEQVAYDVVEGADRLGKHIKKAREAATMPAFFRSGTPSLSQSGEAVFGLREEANELYGQLSGAKLTFESEAAPTQSVSPGMGSSSSSSSPVSNNDAEVTKKVEPVKVGSWGQPAASPKASPDAPVDPGASSSSNAHR